MKDEVPIVLIVLFPIFFVGLWLFIMFVLGHVSGWTRLAARYSTGAPYGGPTVLTSARVGMVGYNNILWVGADEEKLYVSVMKLFALRHPPLAIPWSEVRVSAEKRLFSKTIRFEMDGLAISVVLGGVRSLAKKQRLPAAVEAALGEFS